MQPGGGGGAPTPFGPGQNPFAYNVDTTFVPADEVVPAVPAVPQHPNPHISAGGIAPSSAGAWGAPPPAPAGGPPPGMPQQHMTLQFTDTTAPQYVTGNIQRTEERQSLVPGPRSDQAGGSGAFPGQAPGTAAAAAHDSQPKEDYSKYPFYNVRRYREYFDVDTKDVMWRVGNSMIGVFRPNFMEVTMKNPDLYGPFWAATTLIFITAVAGNFASYIEFRKDRPLSPPPAPPGGAAPSPAHDITRNQWFTDYTKLGTSAALFYGYIFIVGLLWYFVVKYFRGEIKLVNVFCIYGYCMTIFVPVSVACIVPIDWVRWLLVMLATALSAGFLFMNFKSVIYSAAPAKAVPVLLGIVLCQLGVGLALKLYFFQY